MSGPVFAALLLLAIGGGLYLALSLRQAFGREEAAIMAGRGPDRFIRRYSGDANGNHYRLERDVERYGALGYRVAAERRGSGGLAEFLGNVVLFNLFIALLLPTSHIVEVIFERGGAAGA